MIVSGYLFKSPGCLHLLVFTCCLGFECSSRPSASALEHLPLATCHCFPNKAAAENGEEENEQTNSHVKGNVEGKTTGCIQTRGFLSRIKIKGAFVFHLRLVLISVSDKIQTFN